ncbi:2-phospho-L-lactate guanylyltransferase [Streptomyces sp. NPDC127108]|uniref:2-phospho-L-lactate guanylyltransferase n=1 Tax=Streptomyces sp. NPDC127108 TaxID=3345361 RepID=UPI0036308A54
MQWTVVIPLKPLERAKSRLAPAAGDGLRPALALAFAQDTVAATVACPSVRDVVVVTDDVRAGRELTALGAHVVPDAPGDGLNAALAHAALQVRSRRPEAPVAALNADLPALRPRELARVLDAAAPFPRAFLPDAAGIGTTLLTAGSGTELDPQFGGPSRARHRDSGAVELDDLDDLGYAGSVRQDVDTGDDLRAALALGVGPHTAAAAAGLLIPD